MSRAAAYMDSANSLPEYSDKFDEVLRIFVHDARVDGVFTDFPDRAVQFLGR